MTDLILSLATQFWPMTVFIILVIIGLIINLFDKKIDNRVNFTYKDYPHMKPIKIATKGKGFWGALMLWDEIKVNKIEKKLEVIEEVVVYNNDGIQWLIEKDKR